MYIQKKFKKKIREKNKEYNLNPYMYVIVIFLIVPCIYSSYILVSIMEITKTKAFWFKSYPIEIHNGHTSLVVLLYI